MHASDSIAPLPHFGSAMADQPASNSSSSSSLSRLAIDRTAGPSLRRRRPLWKRWWVWLVLVAVIAGAALAIRGRNAPVTVDIATVAAAYPSAAVAVLNATGRVVA